MIRIFFLKKSFLLLLDFFGFIFILKKILNAPAKKILIYL